MPTNPPKLLPTDSYAWIPEPQVPRVIVPPQPDPPEESSKSVNRPTSRTERFLHRLFLLLITLAVFGVLLWIGIQPYSEVASRQPIGRFQRMSGPSGWLGRVVIETEMGSYPLWGTPAIAKGTPLVLEVRVSGDRYICDASRGLCLQTTTQEFKPPEPIPSPAASSRGQTP